MFDASQPATLRRLGSALCGDACDLVARPQRRLSIARSHGAGAGREPLREPLKGSWRAVSYSDMAMATSYSWLFQWDEKHDL